MVRGVLVIGLLALTSCASIVEGSSQEIIVRSNPAGATCTLEREDSTIATVATTPATVLIKKRKYDITVKCKKPGYQETSCINPSGAAGATAGNVIFGLVGGPISWGIDSATGADNKYDSPITVNMQRADVGGKPPQCQVEKPPEDTELSKSPAMKEDFPGSDKSSAPTNFNADD